MTSAGSALTVVLVWPDLLGTYGDRGNAAALVHRARARGLDCRVVEVTVHDPIPRTGDIYLIGGGEDGALLLAWEHLVAERRVEDAVEAGAVCLGVCAGFQLLSVEFSGPDGRARNGLGLLDVRCGRIDGPRAVGEVLGGERARLPHRLREPSGRRPPGTGGPAAGHPRASAWATGTGRPRVPCRAG